MLGVPHSILQALCLRPDGVHVQEGMPLGHMQDKAPGARGDPVAVVTC